MHLTGVYLETVREDFRKEGFFCSPTHIRNFLLYDLTDDEDVVCMWILANRKIFRWVNSGWEKLQ